MVKWDLFIIDHDSPGKQLCNKSFPPFMNSIQSNSPIKETPLCFFPPLLLRPSMHVILLISLLPKTICYVYVYSALVPFSSGRFCTRRTKFLKSITIVTLPMAGT